MILIDNSVLNKLKSVINFGFLRILTTSPLNHFSFIIHIINLLVTPFNNTHHSKQQQNKQIICMENQKIQNSQETINRCNKKKHDHQPLSVGGLGMKALPKFFNVFNVRSVTT